MTETLPGSIWYRIIYNCQTGKQFVEDPFASFWTDPREEWEGGDA